MNSACELAPWLILVVDDDELIRRVVRNVLVHAGQEVDTASSVPEALGYLEQRPYHLIITDFRMPGGDGTELVRAVKRRCDGTLIAMITGEDLSTLFEDTSLEDYPDAILAKPFQISQIHRLLRLMQRSEANDSDPVALRISFNL